MSHLRIVGSAALIAISAPVLGMGAYLATQPLATTFDPVSGVPHEPNWLGGACMYVALAAVSAAVGYVLVGLKGHTPRDGMVAGGAAGAALCCLWVTWQLIRGVPLAQLLHWSAAAVIGLAALFAALGTSIAVPHARRGW